MEKKRENASKEHCILLHSVFYCSRNKFLVFESFILSNQYAINWDWSKISSFDEELHIIKTE